MKNQPQWEWKIDLIEMKSRPQWDEYSSHEWQQTLSYIGFADSEITLKSL